MRKRSKGLPRVRLECKRCKDQIRTSRKSVIQSGVCDRCIRESLMRSIPSLGGSSTALEHRFMREQWFHELIYRQVDHGGLVQLGLGKLGFLDETQRSEKRSGRYIDKEQNEYDLLLKSEDGTLVVVEMKRTLDENAVAQVIRYRSSIKRNMGSTPVSCLVAVEINPKTMSVVEELCSAGLDIRVYRLYVDNGHFSIERKENDESGKP